jgi:nucleotide-binding universal stress UspA family protein
MNTILVPLDGSPLADRVLPYVRLLAPVFQARVHLIRAISATEHDRLLMRSALVEAGAGSIVPPVCAACAMADICQGTECAIAQQAACLRASGVEAYADTRVGTAAAVIATTAEQSPNTLIAMATHGRTGLRRWALGSTADTLLHTTSIPLFLVRGDRCAPAPNSAIKRILVPLDGSELARQALPIAIELAVCAQAELLLLQVAARSIEDYLHGFPVATDLRLLLQEQLDSAICVLDDTIRQRSVQVSTVVAVGPTAQTIAEEAEHRHADLIVMATHGYTGIERWQLGSIADQVLRATTTPLLLVRSQRHAYHADTD